MKRTNFLSVFELQNVASALLVISTDQANIPPAKLLIKR